MAAIDFDDLVSSLNGSCIGQEAMDLRALHAHLSQTLFLPTQSAQAGQPTPANSYHYASNVPPPPPSSLQSAAAAGGSSFGSHMNAQRPPQLHHQSSYSKSPFVDVNGYGFQQMAGSPHHAPARLPFTPVSGSSMSSSPASYSAFHSQVASPQEPAFNHNPFGFQQAPPPGSGAGSPFGPSGGGARQTRSQTKARRDQEDAVGNVPPLSGGSTSWARRASSNSRRSLNPAHVAEDVEM